MHLDRAIMQNEQPLSMKISWMKKITTEDLQDDVIIVKLENAKTINGMQFALNKTGKLVSMNHVPLHNIKWNLSQVKPPQ